MVIDNPEAVRDIKQKYWDQLWEVSFVRDDCDVDKVMDGLGIDRTAKSKMSMTKDQLEQAKNTMKANLQQFWDDNESEQSDAEDE